MTSIHLGSAAGLEPLIAQFNGLLDEFKRKRHDLLNYTDAAFDRDYVEFNVNIISRVVATLFI
jgi:hypothetical protein